MNETILGKISSVFFGKRDGRFGLWIILSGTWSAQSSYVCWDPAEITPGEHHKWTEDDRDIELIRIMNKVSELLKQAKVDDVNDLLNIPVEFSFKKGTLDTWRILEEVL